MTSRAERPRRRLPPTEEEWGEQCMKIHTLETRSPDAHLPVSHTCFFSMEWPRYSSLEIAKVSEPQWARLGLGGIWGAVRDGCVGHAGPFAISLARA